MSSQGIGEECALQRALSSVFDERMFEGWKRHGNTRWSLSALVTVALIWAWGPDEGLQQRYRFGLSVLGRRDLSRQRGLTYQSFIKILRTWSERLVLALSGRLRESTRELTNEEQRVNGHVLIAVDGTRIEAPRTASNETWFARVPAHCPCSGKSRSTVRKQAAKHRRAVPKVTPAGPQLWLTVLWHMGAGLLWDWRHGPSGSSERAHLREMLDGLPDRTLLVADAGFQGYEYWRALLDRGHSFVIRVAGQVRLLRGLGYVRRHVNIVYLWPEKNRRRLQPPLVLRLREFHDGRQSMWLVTNLLDEGQLSTKQMSDIYRRRWGVELFFRTFKQTFGRSKLRSHAPHNVELELDWSLLALWVLELWSTRELLSRGLSPRERSTAGALRALHHCLQHAAMGLDFPLIDRLAASCRDGYERRRKSIRAWPRKRQQDKTGAPQIRYPNLDELLTAMQLQQNNA
jgi:hypothetical protein